MFKNELDLHAVVNFGGTDADEDLLLQECFEDHEAYNDVIAQQKFCVLGRKGSGKTAIFRRVLQVCGSSALGFNFSDYPWHYHDKQRTFNVPDEECYLQSWTYFCLISLARLVLKKNAFCVDDRYDNLKSLEKFVADTYGSSEPDLKQIFNPAFSVKPSAEFGFNIGVIKALAKGEVVKLENLPVVFQQLNSDLKQKIYSCIKENEKFYILFDQLDTGFSTTNSTYNLRLIGLLLACKHLNSDAKRQGAPISFCVFLRDDIYGVLQFEDKNKITQNSCTSVL